MKLKKQYIESDKKGTYKTDVDVSRVKGLKKVKALNWKTRHTAYGILGTSGKSLSLGVIYDGSVSSANYKTKFSVEKTKEYSCIYPVYTKIWGVLDVKTTNGEFNATTETFSHIE